MAALAKNNSHTETTVFLCLLSQLFFLLPHKKLSAEVFLRVLPNAPITIQASKAESPVQEHEEKVLMDFLCHSEVPCWLFSGSSEVHRWSFSGSSVVLRFGFTSSSSSG